jgi:hypothetical protein
MPLSAYLKEPAPKAVPQPDWPVWNDASMTNAEFFRLSNFLMQFVIPNEMDAPIYAEMAKLGIGPKGGYDPAKLSPEIVAAINKGINDAHKQIVDGAAAAKDSSKFYGDRAFMKKPLPRPSGRHRGRRHHPECTEPGFLRAVDEGRER